MSYKTILVHCDERARATQRIQIAGRLAQKMQAHLVGLATVGEPFMLAYVGGYESAVFNPVEVLEQSQSLAKAAAVHFETTAKEQLGLSVESRIENGPASWVVCNQARCADLVVLGQVEPDSFSFASPENLVQEVVLGAGRPTLIIPHTGSFPVIGEKILVLWNATKEAARAVVDALPLLKEAKEVQVVVFDAKANSTMNSEQGHQPSSDIVSFLARHHVKVKVHHATSAGDIGAAALSKAADFGSDLIVMGAYGHSRLRELVLGGASRTILDSMTVPVLMSH